jgi:hypothetical protein
VSSNKDYKPLRKEEMSKRFERRLRAMETSSVEANTGEVWIELSDGMMRGPRGEVISRAAFELACSRLAAVVILPDNERDPDIERRLYNS